MAVDITPDIDVSANGVLAKFKRKPVVAVSQEQVRASLKKGIWVYFVLLIFEGALRKWFLPALATPLLIVRDPVAIWLLYKAWKHNELPSNVYIWGMLFVTIMAFFTALTLGHRNLIVAIYGARILLFHFPLIFLIGRIFTREDVLKMGKMLLIIAIPMTCLIALQFYSPQSAFVNKGIGADSQGGGFSGALGYFRPPGTFSFTTGNSEFYGVVALFVIYFWISGQNYVNRLLLFASTIALIAAIPLSISRTLFFQVAVSMIFAAVSIIRKPKYLGRMIVVCIGLVLVLALLSKATFFSNAIDALTTRFDNASQSEGTIGDTFAARMAAGLFETLDAPLPFFGYGIGMGTNAGAQLLVGHSDEFLIAEAEWGRLVGEMGVLLGCMAILIRLGFCFKLLSESYKRLIKSDFLPWMILSVSFLAVAQGQWAQPTALGFGVILGGISIAALKAPAITEKPVKPVLLRRKNKI
jgi:hypothetical protein